MRKTLVVVLALVIAVIGFAAKDSLAKGKAKKEKPAAAAKQVKVYGTIRRSSKETSTLTVGKGGAETIVHYTASTKWTRGTKEADAGEFKEGSRVICQGNYDEKKEFVATRIDLREGK